MTNYYNFSQKHFEYELRGLLIKNRLGFMEDITDEWKASGKETWERIYKISTKNKAVDIIIYSSVDIRTKSVRDNGTDAVRVVLRWKTKYGEVFKKIGKNYRVKNLFNNLKGNIEQAQGMVFNLNFKEFAKAEVA